MEIIRKGNKEKGVRVTTDLSSTPDISIHYYPYYIKKPNDFDTVESDSLVSLSDSETKIEVFEDMYRPLSDWPGIVDIIITFVSLRLLEGFFTEIGSDIYKKLKTKLKEIAPIKKDANGKDIKTGVHLCFTHNLDGKQIRIKAAIRIDDLDKLNEEPFTLDSIIKVVEDSSVKESIQEVMIAKTNEYPYWKIISFLDLFGKYNRL